LHLSFRAIFETPDRGSGAAGEVAALLAGPLGWDEARRREQVARYRAGVDAALAAEREDSDEAALAAAARVRAEAP
jgi:glycerol-3-phosphate dehydrogenase